MNATQTQIRASWCEEYSTWEKFEREIVARRVSVARAAPAARKPEFERRTVGNQVPVVGADLDDGQPGLLVLVDDRSIVDRKLREVVVHVHQIDDQRSCSRLRWRSYKIFEKYCLRKITVWRRKAASAEEVARSQHLFPYLSWLTSGRTSSHQKLVPTFPWMLSHDD